MAPTAATHTFSSPASHTHPSTMKRILLISLLVCLAALIAAEPRKPDCTPYFQSPCPDQSQPVCGADGQTYPNECALCKQMEEVNEAIMLVNDGPCV